jgi:DNA-directed RNA polymerase subunit RPC12/RpoP
MQTQSTPLVCAVCGWSGDVGAYTRARCPMCNRRRAQEWRERHPERVAAQAKAARERITEDRRADQRVRGARLHAEYRNAALRHYGGRCACCGEDNWRFLAIDHIDGGGGQHRREVGTLSMARWLVQQGFPEGFRLLCHNCNHARGAYGFCPHELTPEALAVDMALPQQTSAPRRTRGRRPLV